MKKVYPVIFTQADGAVLVEVPDLQILTEGTDMADAIDMARDAIGLKGITIQDRKADIQEPSNIQDIDISAGTFTKDGTSYISLVDIDFDIYRRKNDNRSVRRNITLPNWLDYEAEEAGINVSKVLQEALMVKLEVRR
jgi:predicted RNase H-like HicB family nuclease